MLDSVLIKANCMHPFPSGSEKTSAYQHLEGNVCGIHYSKQLTHRDSPALIFFILLRIPEVIMSLPVEQSNPAQPAPLPASGKCTTTKWSHRNYSFHAWKGTFSQVIWRAQRNWKKNLHCDWQGKDGNYLPVSAPMKTPLSQNQSVSFSSGGIITTIFFFFLSQLLTAEGASVMQITIVIVTRWTFHSPSFNAACHGTLVVDSFPIWWNVPCNLWKPVFWLFVTASPANRSLSRLPLAHTTEITIYLLE